MIYFRFENTNIGEIPVFLHDSIETIMTTIFYNSDFKDYLKFYYKFIKLELVRSDGNVFLNNLKHPLMYYLDSSDVYNDVYINIINLLNVLKKDFSLNMTKEQKIEKYSEMFLLADEELFVMDFSFIQLDETLKETIKRDYDKNISKQNERKQMFEKYKDDNFSMANIMSIGLNRLDIKYKIDLNKVSQQALFNFFEIDDEFKFIYYKSIKTGEKMVKFDKNYTNEAKMWLRDIKTIRGRGNILKFLDGNTFLHILIANNLSYITVSFTKVFKKINNETDFNELIEKGNSIISKFLKKINYPIIELNPIITNLQVDITTNFFINLIYLKNNTNKKSLFSKVLLHDDTAKTSEYSGYYLYNEIKDDLETTSYSTRLNKKANKINANKITSIVKIKNNIYEENSSIINFIGSSYRDIIYLCKILHVINIEKQDKRSKHLKKSHTKELRLQGVQVSSTNCQVERQPNIADVNTIPLDDAYILEYNGKKFVCNNPEYKYPGFTNKNIVCCYKKDQRNKENYIRNMTVKKVEHITPTSHHLLKTDSILNSGSYGYLDKILLDYFQQYDVSPFRGGVFQNEYSFINAITECHENTFADVIIDNLNGFIKDNFKNYPLTEYKTAEEFIIFLNGVHYNYKYLVEIISDFLQKNVIIISVPFQTTLSGNVYDYAKSRILYTNVSLIYPTTILLLKRENFFEILIPETKTHVWKSSGVKNPERLEDDTIKYIWETKNKVIEIFINIIEESRENIYPEDYPYQPLPKYSEMMEEDMKAIYNITGQVINKFNQCIFLTFEKNNKIYVIPIEKTNIKKTLKVFTYNDIPDYSVLEYRKETQIEIIEYITKGQKIVAGISIYGQIIPLKDTLENVNKNKLNRPISTQKYYKDIEDVMFNISIGKSYELNEQEIRYNHYSSLRDYVSDNINKLSKYIKDNNQRKTFEDILNSNKPKPEKLSILTNLLKSFNILPDDKNLLNYISNFLTNDLVNQKIFSNTFKTIIKQTENDIVLANEEQIEEFFKDLLPE